MANVIDVHVHFGAPGENGSPVHGCYWSPGFENSAAYWGFRLIAGAIFGKIDYNRVKNVMTKVVNGSSRVDQCVFFAFDQVYDESGNSDMTKWTNLYVANRTIAEMAAGNPKILFGASIHPYRPDWQAELDYCLDNKAVLCKWLPSSQCIDPSHLKCIPFYEALAAHNLPLLCHVGPEASIPTWDKSFEKFNNALYLKPALERGVPVIFAHCSLPFEPASLEQDDVFQQFLSVMRDAKNDNYGPQWQAYADISALCLLRSSYVPYLLSNIDSSRFLFGSDYPIPMMDLSYKKVPSIWDWIKHFWETLTAKNRLDKNYLLLEDMGFPPEVFSAAEGLFNKITYV